MNGTHKASCTHLVDYIYQHLYNRLQQFLKTKSIVLPFTNTKAQGTKFDLGIKQVKVIPGISFDLTWKYSSTQCCIPIFMVIRLLVQERRRFFRFLPYMGTAANLVM